VISFFDEVKGGDYKLDDKCLGADFDANVQKLIDAVNNTNTMLALAYGKQIYDDINASCPVNDVKQIAEDAQKDSVPMNVMANANAIMKLLKEELNETTRDANNVGHFLGKLVNLVVYGKKTDQRFLEIVEDVEFLATPQEDISAVVKGIFDGFSAVPVAQNRCSKDITGFNDQINKVVADLINAIQTKKGILDALMEVYKLVSSLPDFQGDCNFNKLATQLQSLKTKEGISAAAFRVVKNPIASVSDLKAVYEGFKSQNYYGAGLGLGKFLSIFLDYTTN